MKNFKEYVRHILDEADFIEKECAFSSFERFNENQLLTRAVVRSLEIIGEAVKNIPPEILADYPEVERKNIARARDRLIHHYFGVDYYIVWDIVKNHIPLLKEAALKIIGREES